MKGTIIQILAAFIALKHIGFLYLEMFLWTKERGRKAFGLSQQDAETTKVLAANQGLYNGFLAAGLIWGLLYPEQTVGYQIIFFFASCIIVAGLYGGFTVKRSILYLQALPSLVLVVLLFTTPSF